MAKRTAPAVASPTPPAQAREHVWSGWIRGAIHAADQGPLGPTDVSLEAPPPGAESHAVQVVLTMADARASHRRGNYRRARALLNRARQLLRTGTSLPPHEHRWLAAWLQLWHAHQHYARGAFSRAARLYARTEGDFQALGETRGAASAARGLGNVYKYLGLYGQAAELYDRAQELARACGDAIGAAAAEHNQGNVLLALGEPVAAARAYRHAITAFRKAGHPDLARHATMSLATVAQRRGRHAEAIALLRRAAPPPRAGAMHAGDEAERLVALAEAEAALGRISSAGLTLERAIAFARAAEESHTEALAHRAQAALLLERRTSPPDALAAALRGLACSRTARTPTEITGELHELAARAAERAGAWRESARHYASALAEQKRLAVHRSRQRSDTLALSRELARARHHAELARLENARLSEALAEIAARLDAEKSGRPAADVRVVTAASFRALGLRPRECEVLLWLVRGKSNEEIGIILCCSGETVKSHLKRIYAQLDVTNRTSAAAKALSTGAQ